MSNPEELDLLALFDLGGLAQTSAPQVPSTVSVPLMITRAQKAKLRDIGYSDAVISTMTPEDAQRLLQLPKV